ncbi:MAG: ROK family protein [Ignavibacteria bacterium]|jgi:glucokinase|nr:ROK family protein [Ignavibacteria bacterium]
MERTVVGIDIGGTNSPFGFVDENGNILAKGTIRTDFFAEFEEYLKALLLEIELKKLENNLEVAGYGIGAPNGNYYHGSIENAPNLRWKGIINFTEQVSGKTGLPAFLTNDANAAAIGEKIFGNAKDMNDFIVITLGTGLGSGIFCGGHLLYGSTGFAGELGHVVVDFEGRQCGCGRKGCLETYASATGIVRTVLEKLQDKNIKSGLRNYPQNKIDSKIIYDEAVKGDELALEAFEFTGEVLGKALANAAAFSSPEAIFLFGGLANAGDYIFKPAFKYMEDNMLNNFKGTVKLLKSGLKENNAAILGAAALCWNELKK